MGAIINIGVTRLTYVADIIYKYWPRSVDKPHWLHVIWKCATITLFTNAC